MASKIFIIVFSFVVTTSSYAYCEDGKQRSLAEILVQYGASSKYKNPLNYALEENDYQSALLLIKFIGDVDTRDDHWLPLDRLINKCKTELSEEQEELFRIFSELKAKNSSSVSSESLIFHKAANFGSLDLINWLLSKGIDLLDRDGYPFLGAVSSGNVDLVRYLLSFGLDIKKIKGFLNTAISSHNLDLVVFVWEELGQRPQEGWGNPLNVVIKNHDLEILVYLLNQGLSPNQPHNFVLRNALSLPENSELERKYKYTVVELLLSHGAEY